MNRKMLMASLLVFGLGMGVSAMANTPGVTSVIKPGITPQQAQCIGACESVGRTPAECWAECVK
jgi:uncharacterized membrane-anchored protein